MVRTQRQAKPGTGRLPKLLAGFEFCSWPDLPFAKRHGRMCKASHNSHEYHATVAPCPTLQSLWLLQPLDLPSDMACANSFPVGATRPNGFGAPLSGWSRPPQLAEAMLTWWSGSAGTGGAVSGGFGIASAPMGRRFPVVSAGNESTHPRVLSATVPSC